MYCPFCIQECSNWNIIAYCFNNFYVFVADFLCFQLGQGVGGWSFLLGCLLCLFFFSVTQFTCLLLRTNIILLQLLMALEMFGTMYSEQGLSSEWLFTYCYVKSLYEHLAFKLLQFSVTAGMKHFKNIFFFFLLSIVCIPNPKASPTPLPQFMYAPDSKGRRKLEREVSHLCKGYGIQIFLTHIASAVCETLCWCNLGSL